MRFVHLKDRSLISLSGDDTFSFLQGIVTNDIEILRAGEPCYSAILSPQGKIICDFTLIMDHNRVLLDCHLIRQEELVQRLSRYKLRSDVAITPMNHMSVCCILQLDSDCEIDFESTPLYADPRHPSLGQRLIHPKAEEISVKKTLIDLGGTEIAPERYYDLCLGLGIVDFGGDIAPETQYPLELGLDFINGVSFSKGCYVGQEVTTRMKTRNLVKKIPAIIDTTDQREFEIGEAIKVKDRDVGKIISVSENYAIALVSISDFKSHSGGFSIDRGGLKIPATPPFWLR
ncbi:MAG: hypothetical protein VW235_07635 [Rhodospirillaceae bacterium]